MEEIKGMQFHWQGSEIVATMQSRAKYHEDRVESLKKDLSEAETALSKAKELGAKAGSSRRPRPMMRAAVGGGYESTRRDYGGDMEDPVGALQSAIAHHMSRSAALKCYAAHILTDRVYVLSASDMVNYELLVDDSESLLE